MKKTPSSPPYGKLLKNNKKKIKKKTTATTQKINVEQL